MTSHFIIADPGLAEAGVLRIRRAAKDMVLMDELGRRYEAKQPLRGLRILSGLPVSPETAVYLKTLERCGAEITVVNSGIFSTQDDIAAALAVTMGYDTYAVKGESEEAYWLHLEKGLEKKPHILLDDGAIFMDYWKKSSRTDSVFCACIGAVEETRSGVTLSAEIGEQYGYPYPIIEIDSAKTKHLIDNCFGTGQSVVSGILASTGKMMAGCRVLVIGYGNVGQGTAHYLRQMGAEVLVAEKDSFRALSAYMMGYSVMPLQKALPTAEIVITATGTEGVIGEDEFPLLKDGVILANAGHDFTEIDKGALERQSSGSQQVNPYLVLYLAAGRVIGLLCGGGVVNLGVNAGCPADVMDASFSASFMGVLELAEKGTRFKKGIRSLDEAADKLVADMYLRKLGVLE